MRPTSCSNPIMKGRKGFMLPARAHTTTLQRCNLYLLWHLVSADRGCAHVLDRGDFVIFGGRGGLGKVGHGCVCWVLGLLLVLFTLWPHKSLAESRNFGRRRCSMTFSHTCRIENQNSKSPGRGPAPAYFQHPYRYKFSTSLSMSRPSRARTRVAVCAAALNPLKRGLTYLFK